MAEKIVLLLDDPDEVYVAKTWLTKTNKDGVTKKPNTGEVGVDLSVRISGSGGSAEKTYVRET